jgi:hypothetical protein
VLHIIDCPTEVEETSTHRSRDIASRDLAHASNIECNSLLGRKEKWCREWRKKPVSYWLQPAYWLAGFQQPMPPSQQWKELP